MSAYACDKCAASELHPFKFDCKHQFCSNCLRAHVIQRREAQRQKEDLYNNFQCPSCEQKTQLTLFWQGQVEQLLLTSQVEEEEEFIEQAQPASEEPEPQKEKESQEQLPSQALQQEVQLTPPNENEQSIPEQKVPLTNINQEEAHYSPSYEAAHDDQTKTCKCSIF